ncbi:MAG: TonB-dependent receptor [Dinghuibacter sp.]|nr:TonB-dependent receptor [Dinghuibacter sp.]
MKKYFVFYATICSLFFLMNRAQAQENRLTIKGIVTDSVTGKPLSLATVSLLQDKSTVLKVVVSADDGSFQFQVPQGPAYILVLTDTRYQAREVAVQAPQNGEITNVGTILLVPKVKGMSEVVVIGRKPIIRREADRIVYDMQADPDSKANSLLDMMRKVPYLSLDAQQNLLLKGNASYRILINGKETGMVERNPREILQSIPASTIVRVEVITTPPSKYDAEGLAGIINIITVKKTGNGLAGNLNLFEKFPVGGPGLGFSLTSRKGKFGFNSYGGGSIYNLPRTNQEMVRVTTGSNASVLSQNGYNRNDSKSGYLGAEMSYEIDSVTLLFAGLGINGSRSEGSFFQSARFTPTSGLQRFDQQNTNNGYGSGVDASMHLQHNFRKNKARMLTVSYRYFQYVNSADNRVNLFNKLAVTTPDYLQNNLGKASEHTVQADYVEGIKGVNLEAGLKGIFRRNNSDFRFQGFNELTGIFETDPSRTNTFNNTQNVLSAYGSAMYSSKNWDYRGGVRIEQTLVDVDFISTGTNVKQNYFNVVPSLFVNRRFENNSFVNMAYMQRIKRPGINRLNPFVDRSNPNFETTGNPQLRPVVLNVVQLGYGISKKVSINLSTDYSFGRNLDIRISVYDPATGITRATFQNTGRAERLGFDANLNMPITKNWQASLNANAAYFWLQGDVAGTLTRFEQFTHSGNLSTSLNLQKGWQAGANMNVTSRMPIDLQGTTNGLVGYGLNLSKRLANDRLTLATSLNNFFNRYRNNISTTLGPNFEQELVVREYFAAYNFSLNYQFGKMRGGIKRNRRGINNNDVSN